MVNIELYFFQMEYTVLNTIEPLGLYSITLHIMPKIFF